MAHISKDEGMGPYLYVLQYRSPSHVAMLSSIASQEVNEGELMTCIFSTWNDLHDHREKLESNGIHTTWDLAVDHCRVS